MRSRWKYNVVAATLALSAVVVAVVIALGGSDEDTAKAPGPSETAPPPEEPTFVHSASYNIFVVGVTGRPLRQLTRNDIAQLAAGPGWSPQKKIVFSEAESGEQFAELFLMNPDGSGRRRIETRIRHLFQPTWAPDGRRVAVVKLGSGLYEVDVRSGKAHRLTSRESDEAPAWSPVGETIAFSRQVTATNPELYLVDAGSRQIRRLTRDRRQQTNPSWSSDGTRLVFAEQQRNGNWGLVTMKLDGSERRLLIDQQLSGQDPAWSPDGKKIAFVLQQPGRDSIAVVDADGGEPKLLTSRSVIQATAPAWSSDGKRIVFAARRPARPPPTRPPGLE